MHAYLLEGEGASLNIEVAKLLSDLGSAKIAFDFRGIEDAKKISRYAKMALSTKTTIVLANIEMATTEAFNAFLKTLEEPQANLSYILTTRNVNLVPDTIVSRCIVHKVATEKPAQANYTKALAFITKSPGNQLVDFAKIAKKDDALTYLDNLITDLHSQATKHPDPTTIFHALKAMADTYNRIKANGNVTLQLTTLVVKLASLRRE